MSYKNTTNDIQVWRVNPLIKEFIYYDYIHVYDNEVYGKVTRLPHVSTCMQCGDILLDKKHPSRIHMGGTLECNAKK